MLYRTMIRECIRLYWIEDIIMTSHEHSGVPSHRQLECLPNNLLRLTAKNHQKFALVFALGEGNPPVTVNSPDKRPVRRKLFHCDDVIMNILTELRLKFQHDMLRCRICSSVHEPRYCANTWHAPKPQMSSWSTSLVYSNNGGVFV